eukprot:c2155_g1_i1.p1 GENE.c2155_g1_i1~~c2155_g1_i1.p1  ORF type:complete len:199 (+),score=39.78 c2155_g1_i1:30-599(+)
MNIDLMNLSYDFDDFEPITTQNTQQNLNEKALQPPPTPLLRPLPNPIEPRQYSFLSLDRHHNQSDFFVIRKEEEEQIWEMWDLLWENYVTNQTKTTTEASSTYLCQEQINRVETFCEQRGCIAPSQMSSFAISKEHSPKLFDDMCSVCLDSDSQNQTIHLACGHHFHNHCIKKYFKFGHTCPNCRCNFQ